MDPERFQLVQTLFQEAVDLPFDQQQDHVRRACGDDTELAGKVLAMIEEDRGTAPVLDDGIAVAARDLLSEADTLGQIGPYRMLRVLGEGGMGVVCLAERTDLGTQAAVKILRDAWLSPSRRDRFAAEQRTLARLNHPSIARFQDAGVLPNGTPWIVMEYVDGVPITDYCRTRALPLADRLQLVRTVALAVQHAHQHLVVHRDLKPSNVLVTTEGVVKLLDFGIAKQLDALGADTDRTRTVFRMMTPAYAAPEQVRGDAVGVHTDVYGLGALAYEVVTGQAPLDIAGCTPSEAESRILHQDPPRPSTVAAAQGARAAAWADLDVLCLTAMHKDPARRYQSAEAFLRDVDHYLRGEPLEARPDTLRYRTAKFVRRNRVPIAASVAAVAVLVLTATFYTVRLSRARDAALAESARAQRMQGLMTNLLTGGENATAPAESLRVLDVLDRGAREADGLAADPAAQADLFRTLANLYQALGKFSEAETLSGKALDGARTLYGGDSAEVAQTLVARGLLRMEQGKFDEAEQLTRQGLDMARRHLPPGDPQIARALTAVGQVLEEKGGYPEATAVLEEAAALHSARQPASADLASSLRQLGNVHFYAGRFDDAGRTFERVLAMTRQVNGARHALVAEDLINVGAVHFERGRYAEAERYYRDALVITEAWYGPEHQQTASNLTMLGRTLTKENRFDEAVEVLRRSLAIQERVFGPVHTSVASAINELGSVALQQKNYPEARAAFRRMADIYKAVFPKKHYLTGIAISNLASVLSAEEQFVQAEPLFREAVAIYSDTQSPTHLNTGIARIKLGRTLLRQQRLAEAEGELQGGYDIVVTQTSPTVTWLMAAREDLIQLYTATGRPAQAQRYRDELAAVAKSK